MKTLACIFIMTLLATPAFAGFDDIFQYLYGVEASLHQTNNNQDGPSDTTEDPLGSNTDDTTIVTPAPGAVLLCSLGVAVAARLRRNRSF